MTQSSTPFLDGQTGQNNNAKSAVGLGDESEGIGQIIREYLDVLLKWWWIPALSVILITALTYWWASNITPEYRATATIEIKQQQANMLGEDDGSQIIANDEFFITQLSLLNSASMAKRVIEDLDLLSDPIYAAQTGTRDDRIERAIVSFRRNLDISRVGRSRLVAITFEETRPAMAAQIVNTMADNFIRFDQERRVDIKANARDFVTERLGSTKILLEQSERDLFDYSREAGILTVLSDGGESGSDNLDGNALRTLNAKLLEARTKRIEAETLYKQSQQSDFISEIQSDDALAALRSTQTRLTLEYQEQLKNLKPGHPDMIAIQSQIDGLRRQISIARSDIVSTIEAQYQNALSLEQEFVRRIANLKRNIVNTQNADFQYTILRREVDSYRTQYDALLQKQKNLMMSDGADADLIALVDKAPVPRAPFSPNLQIILAIAGVLSLLLGVAAVIITEALDDTVKTPNDLRDKLSLHPLGATPLLKKHGNASMMQELDDPLSGISEGYASLRSSLGALLANSQNFCLQITSTRASEGKSSAAFALAKSFAESNRKVLLIDADLRKPGFDTPTGYIGLTGLLMGGGQIDDHVHQTNVDNLSLIPTGAIPDNPAALLSGQYLADVIKQARAQYDVVIVDSPPILGLADALILSTHVDGSLMIVESNGLRTPALKQALKRLRGGGANIVGALLTKYKPQHGRSMDDYYYYYSYVSEGYSETKSRNSRNKKGFLPQKKAVKKTRLNITG